MGFSIIADRMMWQPDLSRDRKWPRVTKYTHSWVVGLRLKDNLVTRASSATAVEAGKILVAAYAPVLQSVWILSVFKVPNPWKSIWSNVKENGFNEVYKYFQKFEHLILLSTILCPYRNRLFCGHKQSSPLLVTIIVIWVNIVHLTADSLVGQNRAMIYSCHLHTRKENW